MGSKIKKFGRYLLLKKIARGGMAEIFRAMAFGGQGFSKYVVLKRMLPDITKDHQFVDMFVAEAKLVATLNHANIVQIYDFGLIDDRLYLAMEYVQGMNLSQVINDMRELGQPVPIATACYIITEALYGLDHAHRQTDQAGKPLNIIHRDVSPSNIIVSFEGHVRLVDFGIAKATQVSIRTQSGILKGKFKYMSPEQARGKPLDQRTDLFSTGICLYKLLTLRDAYDAEKEFDRLHQARECLFPKPTEINPNIPEELEKIILKAMHPDRDQRYDNAAQMRDAMESFAFTNNLQMFSSDLARFMRTGFSDKLKKIQSDMAKEAKLLERYRPSTETIRKVKDSDYSELRTLIVDREQLSKKFGLPKLGDESDIPTEQSSASGTYSESELNWDDVTTTEDWEHDFHDLIEHEPSLFDTKDERPLEQRRTAREIPAVKLPIDDDDPE